MEERISIFTNLREETKISLNPFQILTKDGYYLVLIPETGAWATIATSDKILLDYLSTPKTLREIIEFKQYHACASDFIDNLFYSGIIRVNEKDIFMLKEGNEEPDLPLFWVLKYTNACNLRCAYCYSYDANIKGQVSLPNEYVYKVSDLIKTSDDNHKLCFCFHGGEPLIRFRDIVECVDELKRRRNGNVEFTIQTNGTLLTPQIAKYLKKEEFSVGISVDGFNEETNHLRPYANHKTSVHRTLMAIKYCVDAGITPGVISVMTNNISDKSIEIIKNLSELGIKSFHFNHFIPSGRGENKEKDFSISIKDILDIRIKMLLYINDYNASREKSQHISERYTRNLIRRLTQQRSLSYMCAQSPCGAGRRILTLAGNGDVFPCDDLGTISRFKIAHINDIRDLKTTLKESESVKLCQTHCIDNIPQCKECIYRNMCISHCCSDSFHYTGNFYAPYSACEAIKEFIPTVIDMLYKGRIDVENLID